MLLSKLSSGFVIRIAGMGISYLFMIWVTKTGGVDTWGMFFLMMSILNVFLLFGKFGFDTAFLHYTSKYIGLNQPKVISQIYKTSLRTIVPINIVLSILLFFLAEIISTFLLNRPEMTDLLKICSLCLLPFTLLMINSEGLRGLNKINAYLLFQFLLILTITFSLLFSFYFFTNEISSRAIAISYSISITLNAIASLILLRIALLKSHHKKEKSLPLGTITTKEIRKKSIPMFLSNAIVVIIEWFEIIIIGIYMADSDVGLYSISLKLSNLMMLPLIITSSIIAPVISTLFNTNKLRQLKGEVYKNSKILTVLSLIGIITLLSLKNFAISFFGVDYNSINNILLILLIGQFINTLFGPTDYLLLMTNKEKSYQNTISISMLLNLSLNLILIPTVGLLGAAITNVATKLVWNIIAFIIVKKHLNFYPFWLFINKNDVDGNQ